MIQIITDSAADFEPAELERMNITCIPLTVMFGDTEYQENVNLGKDQFYELLAGTKDFPKTAQPSPQVLMDLFENAADGALYITISSALSGTYQTAVTAKNTVGGENCAVIDSRNATGGQRLLVEHAVKLRDEGKSLAEIVSAVEALRERIVLYACIDTLEYLYKGGRISHTVYTLGSLAQIKPIITVNEEGGVAVPAKAMGMRKGMDALCKYLTSQTPSGEFPLYVMYTSRRSVAETLAQKIRAQGYEVPDARIIQVGAAIGSHIGPDACGLVYIGQ